MLEHIKTSDLEAELARRKLVSQQFEQAGSAEASSGEDWFVEGVLEDRNYTIGFFHGNPIDIASILPPQAYRIRFKRIKFHPAPLAEQARVYTPNSVDVEFASPIGVQSYVDRSIFKDVRKSHSICDSHFGGKVVSIKY